MKAGRNSVFFVGWCWWVRFGHGQQMADVAELIRVLVGRIVQSKTTGEVLEIVRLKGSLCERH